jgi:hypothetical protein
MSQIIYNHNSCPSEYNDVFNELQDYILDDTNIQKSLQIKMQHTRNKNDNNNKKIVQHTASEKTEEKFIPIEKDTLFWCYYIIVNGDIKYESLNHKNTLVEKQLKIDLVSLVRKNKDLLKKNGKFDTIINIENNLANENNINIKTFLSLCAIAKVNIIYVSKKTYFESLMNDTSVVYVVSEVFNKYYKKYGYQLATDSILNNIRETLYKLDKVDKQIKAISSYKVEELVNICSKLAIETSNKDTGKTKSKKDLYESIIQYF